MLSLSDPRWSKLQHAYGSAANVPKLLRMLASSSHLKTEFEEEPWFSLWSSLCHQGDVYTASYAAVPHIVQIANDTDEPIDISFFALPTAIEIARTNGRGPDIPDELAGAYHRAIASLCDAVSLHRNEAWNKEMLRAAAAAMAVAKGHIDAAEAFLGLDDDWIARINAKKSD